MVRRYRTAAADESSLVQDREVTGEPEERATDNSVPATRTNK
ncbi:hypothetical protein ACQP1G_41540 [Nocardia sp. CA-107356]